MKAINIKWDVCDYVNNGEGLDYTDWNFLPDEVEIPEGVTDEDEISNFVSDLEPGILLIGYKLVD